MWGGWVHGNTLESGLERKGPGFNSWQGQKRFIKLVMSSDGICKYLPRTSGYATWFTAGGAIRIAHYDVIDDVITRKL